MLMLRSIRILGNHVLALYVQLLTVVHHVEWGTLWFEALVTHTLHVTAELLNCRLIVLLVWDTLNNNTLLTWPDPNHAGFLKTLRKGAVLISSPSVPSWLVGRKFSAAVTCLSIGCRWAAFDKKSFGGLVKVRVGTVGVMREGRPLRYCDDFFALCSAFTGCRNEWLFVLIAIE